MRNETFDELTHDQKLCLIFFGLLVIFLMAGDPF